MQEELQTRLPSKINQADSGNDNSELPQFENGTPENSSPTDNPSENDFPIALRKGTHECT